MNTPAKILTAFGLAFAASFLPAQGPSWLTETLAGPTRHRVNALDLMVALEISTAMVKQSPEVPLVDVLAEAVRASHGDHLAALTDGSPISHREVAARLLFSDEVRKAWEKVLLERMIQQGMRFSGDEFEDTLSQLYARPFDHIRLMDRPAWGRKVRGDLRRDFDRVTDGLRIRPLLSKGVRENQAEYEEILEARYRSQWSAIAQGATWNGLRGLARSKKSRP